MSLHSRLRRVGGRAGTTVPRGAVCEPPNPPETSDSANLLSFSVAKRTHPLELILHQLCLD